MKRIAELWELVEEHGKGTVQCHVCAHHCKITPNSLGFCRTRKNISGELFTLIYGSTISKGSVDPIEKKPLYHFYPNSNAFSIATIGCNLWCKHCQNWHISKSYPDVNGKVAQFTEKDKRDLHARDFYLTNLTPNQVIKYCLHSNSKVIAYTYNEPLIWYEFVKDTALLAKKENIKNVLVTGGYSSKQANMEYIKFIDAVNIDIKGFSNEFYKKYVGIADFKPILDTAEFFKKNKVHVEITNLLIPNENDDEDEINNLARWVFENLGEDTPLHFSAYHPDYRTTQPRTPSKTLMKARKIALNIGLKYVFLGNISSSNGSSTFCPNCNVEIINRKGYNIDNINLTDQNTCAKCNTKLSIVGTFSSSKRRYFL